MKFKTLRSLHVYLGLALALPFFTVSVTGGSLAVLQLLDKIKARGADLTEAPEKKKKIWRQWNENSDVWIRKISQENPGFQVSAVFFPKTVNSPFTFRIENSSGKRVFLVLNAETGSFVEDFWAKLEDSIIKLHRGSWLGSIGTQKNGQLEWIGKVIMSLSAALLLMLWAAGLAIHRSKKGKISQRVSVQFLHSKLGLSVGSFFLVLAVSGGILNFLGDLHKVFDQPLNLSSTSIAATFLPDRDPLPERIYFLKGQSLFYFSDNSRIYFDSQSGVILKKLGPMTPGISGYLDQIYPLHSGKKFGLLGLSLWIFIGIGVGVLLGSGIVWAVFFGYAGGTRFWKRFVLTR